MKIEHCVRCEKEQESRDLFAPEEYLKEEGLNFCLSCYREKMQGDKYVQSI